MPGFGYNGGSPAVRQASQEGNELWEMGTVGIIGKTVEVVKARRRRISRPYSLWVECEMIRPASQSIALVEYAEPKSPCNTYDKIKVQGGKNTFESLVQCKPMGIRQVDRFLNIADADHKKENK